MQKIKAICAVLLTAALLLTCTGCDFPPPVEGAAKLADITVPAETTVDYIWYTFPFSAEQANAVFFGDQPCRKNCYEYGNDYYSDGYEVLLFPDSDFASKERWFIQGKNAVKNMPECAMNGAKNTEPLTFVYASGMSNNNGGPGGNKTSAVYIHMALEPESGDLLKAIENHPDHDASYDTALSDSAAKLAALGYTDVECVFSSKIDVYEMCLLYRAFGHSMELDDITDPYYIVRYVLKSADIPAQWTDGMEINNVGTATFFYNENGLKSVHITGMPCRETIRTEKVRYTPEEALRQIPEDWFRKDCVLVDAYYEPVRVNKNSDEYKGCWTFRFVAPSDLNKVSDERYESMLELLGMAGRYMEMQCQVYVNSGAVIGGSWAFSHHLIHEFNSKHILMK